MNPNSSEPSYNDMFFFSRTQRNPKDKKEEYAHIVIGRRNHKLHQQTHTRLGSWSLGLYITDSEFYSAACCRDLQNNLQKRNIIWSFPVGLCFDNAGYFNQITHTSKPI